MRPNDTTKVCRKCGDDKPLDDFTIDVRYKDGRYPWCAGCRRAWRQGRAAEIRDYNTEWRKNNPERVREQGQEHYRKHKDTIAPKRRAHDRDRWHNDPAYRAKKNKWKMDQYRTNPEFRRKRRIWGALAQHRRRARERALVNTLTRAEWLAIVRDQGRRCAACNRKFGPRLKPTMDHIVPQSQGGALTKGNTQALCQSCNSRKHIKTIDYRPAKQTSFLDDGD